MKTIILTLLTLLLLINSKSYSQESNIQFNVKEFESVKKTRYSIEAYVIDENDNYIILKRDLTGRPRTFRYFLETRDSEGEKKEVKEITNVLDLNDANDFECDYFLELQNKIIVFTSQFDEEKNEKTFSYQSINVNTLKVSKRKEYFTTKYENWRYRPTLEFYASKNENYFLISTSFYVNDIWNYTTTLELLDKNLKTIWKQEEYDFDKKGSSFFSLGFVVGNFGEVYGLRQEQPVAGVMKYKLYRFSKAGVEINELDLGSLDSRGTSLVMDARGSLLFAGYSAKSSIKEIRGIFLKKINKKDLNFEIESESEFSDKMMLYGVAKKENKKTKKLDLEREVHNTRIEHVLNDEEGNIYVVGAKVRSITRSYTSSSGYTSHYSIDHHDHIFVSKFSKDFEHIYDAKIPKLDDVYSKEVIPYTLLVKGRELSIIFIDNRKNLTESNLALNGVKSSSETDNILGISTVSENGVVTRGILYDYKKEGYRECSIISKKAGLTEVLLLLKMSKKEYKLGIAE